MLATFVIGLREGLEAALIVGIIATFLRSNGRRLAPMWIGVAVAVLISAAVAVVLRTVETALPQAAQEGMETVIGAVAIVFVTGMVLWMATHARFLKRDLEAAADDALGDGTSRALALMAFLAVLKEGFETAVFLLATFQAASNTPAAAGGAVLGVLTAALIGIGIFRGGIRLNLARFFTVTSAFLLLVAAGLVLTALRTAHEAHWLNAGQSTTFDLSFLAPTGSVRGALFTGVLGIPADPRLIEVLGWLCYLVPMSLLVFWPRAHRPGAAASRRIKIALAGGCTVLAAGLFLLVPSATLAVAADAPLVGPGGNRVGTATMDEQPPRLRVESAAGTATIPLHDATPASHAGLSATHYTGRPPTSAKTPHTLTLDQVLAMNGGRLPVGLSASADPGPFTADWSGSGRLDAWTYKGHLLDASARRTQVVTLTGGGLRTARTIRVRPAGPTAAANWTVRPSHVDQVARASVQQHNSQTERDFWRRTVPAVLLLTALALLAAVCWSLRGRPPAREPARVPVKTVA